MTKIASWGRLQIEEHRMVALTDVSNAHDIIRRNSPGLAYGMGRSYGDVCLNSGGTLWRTQGLDKFIQFDRVNGLLTCEAGVTLNSIQDLTVPQGWMLQVSPGTQQVTLGGAVANDIHGKNHHQLGTFGHHITELTLLRGDGEVINCSASNNANWFKATIGGLGLTGFILIIQIQLKRIAGPWLNSETIPFEDLDHFFQLCAQSEFGWEHTVAWIDCITGKKSRGLFLRANHADQSNQDFKLGNPRSFPFVPPISLVNGLSLRVFNELYFNLKKFKKSAQLIHYRPFFYPLDGIANWNRMYGPKGFFQYQGVVPMPDGAKTTQKMLDAIKASGQGSFLAVLKTFGKIESIGMLSFPMHGVTLALDFPNNGAKSLELFEKLDVIVSDAGGRIYPAKDARMSKTLFASGYPQISEFLKYRDPYIHSGFSKRLFNE
jgi:FAD/FMN-containing dehydrogenase